MVKNFEDIIRFGATHEHDRRTDGDGHRVTAYTTLMRMHRAVKTGYTTKGPFIATQLNSTRRRVQLS